ncbi:hypothetical protein K437DRAFT_259316 [Tilletiaria anomala UBC 951]|uniref:Uncharacterized protein n=1 Tax=Tilletiaria anomala (strain ATCC 24038 / CBS 436.72 / UBC 951) TaxID=1037660 RepID=A0A066VJ05_TILAU|nr:uncharacterized protein K437DRAFT_259316 [Tilletiaria anomala UBC 951]KDN38709.1 hypothetical protein K437DRAFT_259316 [Tilletiaria anomala UBC 951]
MASSSSAHYGFPEWEGRQRDSGSSKRHRREAKRKLHPSLLERTAWRLAEILTACSFLLEAFLTWCCSLYFWLCYDVLRLDEALGSARSTFGAHSRASPSRHATPSGASQGAWCDASKGSAIVLYGAPSSQLLAQSLAISLASCRTCVSGSRFPSPRKATASSASLPTHASLLNRLYDKLLCLFSTDVSYFGARNHRSGREPFTVITLVPGPDDLSPLIHAWASKKAKLEHPRASQTHEEDTTPRTPRSPEEARSRPSSPPSSSTPGRRSRSRTLSWGQWSAASGIVGFRDLWKGLRVGEDSRRSEFGAVIPVVCDVSTPEGLAHAKSTAMSYCNSHNLLLRGLILVPAGLAPMVHDAIDSPRDSEAAMLFNELSPMLRHDRGRVVRLATSRSDSLWVLNTEEDLHAATVQLRPMFMRPRLTEAVWNALDSALRLRLVDTLSCSLRLGALTLQTLLYPPTFEELDARRLDGPQDVNALLLYSVRSAISRTYPRSKYCVGLGPRLYDLKESLLF